MLPLNFSDFAAVHRSLLALNGHASASAECLLIGEERKTYAQIEVFAF